MLGNLPETSRCRLRDSNPRPHHYEWSVTGFDRGGSEKNGTRKLENMAKTSGSERTTGGTPDDLTDLYGGEPNSLRFLDSNYWVMQRAALARYISLRWWTMCRRRSVWLQGWTDECMARNDPYPTSADAAFVRAYRAGRFHCGRYL